MALDGLTLSFLKNEIKEAALYSRITQIYQPSRDELVLILHTQQGNKKLLLSCRASSPRVHFTRFAPENPPVPPMLCMLMRKKLSGGKLTDVRGHNTERILFFDFLCTDEIGEKKKYTLAAEIMGKHSNIILMDESGIIVDAFKRVDLTMSRERAVLPNLKYELPPPQNKLCILSENTDKILDRLNRECESQRLDKAILNTLEGVSPIVARELAFLIENGKAPKDVIESLKNNCENNIAVRTLVFKEDKTPFDFSFIDICQYGSFLTKKHFSSFSEMLDSFYSEKDTRERMRAKSQDLHKLLNNSLERLRRKILIQQGELEKCKNREELRIKGDLLQANLYRCAKGASFIDVENFYDGNHIIRIKLNPAKPPAFNAQKFYRDYQKAKNGEKMLAQQIEKSQDEIIYLESVLDSLDRAESVTELEEIKNELRAGGYIKENGGKKKQKDKTLPPREYISPGGFKILVGRNNRQNDILTLKASAKTDIWFHTKDIPGSHTILLTNGKEPSQEDLLASAAAAAFHSKGKNGDNVPVDFTLVKYVSKPKGAKPGMVIYTNNRTLYVRPALPKE